MVTRIDPQAHYLIAGIVVDRASQRGVRGVRVDAWDRDTRYHDLLGQAITDERGAFTIGYDSVYFGDFAPDRSPDLFFKVYLDEREVLNTFSRTMMNVAPGATDVKLEIELPQLQVQGTDRVSVEQTVKAFDWWRESDFRGVWNEGRDKSTSIGKVLSAAAGRSLANFDFQPVRPSAVREKEIVNQSSTNAQRALALQGVEVAEVKEVGAGGTGAELRSLKDYPLVLKSGDRVTLFQENGVVKYYTRLPPPDPHQPVDGQTVARIDGDVQSMKVELRGMDEMRTEIANVKTANADVAARTAEEAAHTQAHAQELMRLQSRLEEVQQASAGKDVQIAKLQSDLVLVTKAQDALAARLPLARLEALEQQLNRLSRPTVAAPEAVAAPAGAPTRSAEAGTKTAARRKPQPK